MSSLTLNSTKHETNFACQPKALPLSSPLFLDNIKLFPDKRALSWQEKVLFPRRSLCWRGTLRGASSTFWRPLILLRPKVIPGLERTRTTSGRTISTGVTLWATSGASSFKGGCCLLQVDFLYVSRKMPNKWSQDGSAVGSPCPNRVFWKTLSSSRCMGQNNLHFGYFRVLRGPLDWHMFAPSVRLWFLKRGAFAWRL